MSDFTRRDALALGIGGITSLAIAPPATVAGSAVASSTTHLPAWIVGTPGEYDWQLSFGRTAEEAIRNYVCEEIGADGCENGGAENCDCEWCSKLASADAERMSVWDGKVPSEISPGDWIRSGAGHICSRCGYETHPDFGACGVGDEAVCDECMTLADWDVSDPEHAAKLRAERMDEARHD